ncbi:MAG: FtsX-like permease family protein [Leptolyngbyaceae cyanobacterium CRU_2_3]|nr:FtsX-like permease family protein [Leptolyngbyaceae cyanobacterium CRU_2_3]
MSIAALWSNKLRTGLTMLGVIIGISSVIAITSVGQGVQKATEQQIQALGTDVLQVFPSAARTGGISQGLGSSSTLTWEDAKAIQAQSPVVQVVSAYLQRPGQVVHEQDNHSTNIVGIDMNYLEARNTHLTQGRFFTQAEMDHAMPIAILGSTVQEKLFGSDSNAIGQSLRIQGNSYEIIGVFEPKGSEGSIDRDDQVFIPLSNMSSRIVGNNALNGVSVNGMYVKASDQNQLKAVEFQVTNLLRLRHNLTASQSDDFSIRNQTDVAKTFTTVVGLFTVMVVAIASISLVVGGIGIANIMLVSVVERTREIGIRKAVGATHSAILYQFLAESIVISIAGGCIGMSIGVLTALGAAIVLQFPFVISGWSIVCGLGLSFIVGLLAGVIPARNAARLDPIMALRSD